MLRKSLLVFASLVCSAGAGFAADLPTTKAPPAPVYAPPPVFSWTGFYIGVNAGAAFSNGGSLNIFDPTIPANFHASVGSNVGFIGGGQAGFNYQVGAFVWGIETDIQGVTNGGSSFNVGPYGFLNLRTNNNGGWLGTTRGRVGYAIMDRTLLYATGGVAYGGISNDPFNNETNVGYTVGGGIEYAFDRHWTVKVEGLYVNLNPGNRTVDIVSGGVVYPVTFRSDQGGGIVRAGINYLF